MKQLIILASMVFLAGCTYQETEQYGLVISNVNLIDGTGKPLQTGVSIGINEGKIVAIDSLFILSNSNENSIDGTGKFIIPGLFDCHVHTGNFERDFPRFVHYGVTSVFITGGSLCTNDYYGSMRKQGNQDSIPAPFVFHTSQHFTMEGRHPAKTYQSSNWRDGETIFYLKDTSQIEDLVQDVSQYPVVGIKLTIEDGPAPPFVERMPQLFIDKTVREASKHGLEVFAHVSDNTELEMAINGGVQNLVHFTGVNIDPQDSIQIRLLQKFVNRNPNWVTTLMIDKSFLYPLHPEWFESESMLSVYKESVNELTPELIDRAKIYLRILMNGYGINENSLEAFMLPQVEDIIFLDGMGFNMVLGTDTGNDFNFPGYSLHEEMQLLELGGMEPVDIIKMGTLNAAKMMNAQDSLGSIEVGKTANMVLLDKNPLESIHNTLSIHSVIKRGRIQKRLNQ
ncbi:amidohydrolase family protein [Flexithrix dorotheae]|uniref:amidohydrolase family protein n=1 Tax=Flexithrix dorotheae TaxID=70993 RepID=UPI00037B4280|nr:amidohydrolase family protein [Flexithrix dorotheae]